MPLTEISEALTFLKNNSNEDYVQTLPWIHELNTAELPVTRIREIEERIELIFAAAFFNTDVDPRHHFFRKLNRPQQPKELIPPLNPFEKIGLKRLLGTESPDFKQQVNHFNQGQPIKYDAFVDQQLELCQGILTAEDLTGIIGEIKNNRKLDSWGIWPFEQIVASLPLLVSTANELKFSFSEVAEGLKFIAKTGPSISLLQPIRQLNWAIHSAVAEGYSTQNLNQILQDIPDAIAKPDAENDLFMLPAYFENRFSPEQIVTQLVAVYQKTGIAFPYLAPDLSAALAATGRHKIQPEMVHTMLLKQITDVECSNTVFQIIKALFDYCPEVKITGEEMLHFWAKIVTNFPPQKSRQILQQMASKLKEFSQNKQATTEEKEKVRQAILNENSIK